MNPTKKSLIVSPVIAVVTWLIMGLVQHQTLNIPSTPSDLVALVVLVAGMVAASLVASSGAGAAGDAGDGPAETGTVKWFNFKKGYGFITRDQGDDVFVHYRNIQGEGRRAISEGQRVRFVVVPGDKGLQADEVEAI